MIFTFNDGELYAWTGDTPSLNPVAFVTDIQATPVREWRNIQLLNGDYRNVLAGERVDAAFSVEYSLSAFWDFFEATGQVHLHIAHLREGASAGLYMYSGVIDSMPIQGADGGANRQSVQYHANEWSAYG